MKKLLIVIDYQNDFVDGVLGNENALKIESNIVSKIQKYKKENQDIIYTLDTHLEDYLSTEEGKYLPIAHCLKGSKGHELYGKVKEELEGHLGFEKYTFGSKELLLYLLDKEYAEIELVGVVSNICVISNAVICKSALPNAHIKVDSLAVASNDLEMEQKAFDILRNLHVEVI